MAFFRSDGLRALLLLTVLVCATEAGSMQDFYKKMMGRIRNYNNRNKICSGNRQYDAYSDDVCRYYICHGDGQPSQHYCPYGLIWNQKYMKCVRPMNGERCAYDRGSGSSNRGHGSDRYHDNQGNYHGGSYHGNQGNHYGGSSFDNQGNYHGDSYHGNQGSHYGGSSFDNQGNYRGGSYHGNQGSHYGGSSFDNQGSYRGGSYYGNYGNNYDGSYHRNHDNNNHGGSYHGNHDNNNHGGSYHGKSYGGSSHGNKGMCGGKAYAPDVNNVCCYYSCPANGRSRHVTCPQGKIWSQKHYACIKPMHGEKCGKGASYYDKHHSG